jgi:rubredoxin
MTRKWLQAEQRHEVVTARYKCIICGHIPDEPKTTAAPNQLPAFHEEWCPRCQANRKFIQVKQ